MYAQLQDPDEKTTRSALAAAETLDHATKDAFYPLLFAGATQVIKRLDNTLAAATNDVGALREEFRKKRLSEERTWSLLRLDPRKLTRLSRARRGMEEETRRSGTKGGRRPDYHWLKIEWGKTGGRVIQRYKGKEQEVRLLEEELAAELSQSFGKDQVDGAGHPGGPPELKNPYLGQGKAGGPVGLFFGKDKKGY